MTSPRTLEDSYKAIVVNAQNVHRRIDGLENNAGFMDFVDILNKTYQQRYLSPKPDFFGTFQSLLITCNTLIADPSKLQEKGAFLLRSVRPLALAWAELVSASEPLYSVTAATRELIDEFRDTPNTRNLVAMMKAVIPEIPRTEEPDLLSEMVIALANICEQWEWGRMQNNIRKNGPG